jgi:hypothetical protein
MFYSDILPQIIQYFLVEKGKKMQYYAGGKIETNEMGRACGAYGEG